MNIDWLTVGSRPEKPKIIESKKSIIKAKKKKPRVREKEIRKLESDYANGIWKENPESPWDFERLIIENKKSTETWIRYVAYHLNNSNIKLAREVIERAINTMSINDIQEKLDLWTAYLNMEVRYGDANDIFKRSIHSNDPATMYIKMFKIYTKCKKIDMAIEVASEGIGKFPDLIELWIDLIELYYKEKRLDSIKEIHKKASQRCSKKDFIHITSQIALFEYKYGDANSGQDIFEKLLDENAKRMDIWQKYIDAHIKYKLQNYDSMEKSKRNEAMEQLRNIFKRATFLGLKPKKMKIIFSKWLSFEMDFGDDKSQNIVRERARQYVESLN